VKNKEIKRKFEGDFSELRKIINSWELIPGSPIDEFDDLNHRILSQLYKEVDYEKVERILKSELSSNYGLFNYEFDSKKIIASISEWWNKKLIY
jgi:hypothetical protein